MEGNILFFDGHCHVCQFSVQFILKNERDKSFLFAPLQGKAAVDLPSDLPDSLIVKKGDQILMRSEAVMEILKHCKSPWRWFRIFRIIPKGLLNWIYDFIARNRHKWFGKSESCMMPDPDWKDRFLE